MNVIQVHTTRLATGRFFRKFHRTALITNEFPDFDIYAGRVRPKVNITSFTNSGFYVSTNGTPSTYFKGPLALVKGLPLLWNPLQKFDSTHPDHMYGDFSTWNNDVFAAITLIRPIPEIMVFGTGKDLLMLPSSIRSHFKELGIALEVQATVHACSTVNVLMAEGRDVAACLLPKGLSLLQNPS